MNAINLIESGSFAEACYNQNSARELEEALTVEPDPVDMETWGLTEDEYYAQIKLALAAKREDALEQIPGYAANVWGGFIWIDGDGNEQRWSKRATKEECEAVVLETCNRLGVEEAFA